MHFFLLLLLSSCFWEFGEHSFCGKGIQVSVEKNRTTNKNWLHFLCAKWKHFRLRIFMKIAYEICHDDLIIHVVETFYFVSFSRYVFFLLKWFCSDESSMIICLALADQIIYSGINNFVERFWKWNWYLISWCIRRLLYSVFLSEGLNKSHSALRISTAVIQILRNVYFGFLFHLPEISVIRVQTRCLFIYFFHFHDWTFILTLFLSLATFLCFSFSFHLFSHFFYGALKYNSGASTKWYWYRFHEGEENEKGIQT